MAVMIRVFPSFFLIKTVRSGQEYLQLAQQAKRNDPMRVG